MIPRRSGARTDESADGRWGLVTVLLLLCVVVAPLLALSPSDASSAVLAGALGLTSSYLATTWTVERTDAAAVVGEE
ncbi:hypothetical protein [Halomarina pelagica]|uniref:hypothetical protein n=1 Tax=Halomarina pelagica TaxID=2961599 RepID=UPI0020C28167|nr:hypothetical protein [Halomarina sp. BND7]